MWGSRPEPPVCAPMCLQPVVARLGIPLAASHQGTTRALSTVTDSAGARPRKAGTERLPGLIDFCCFRHHLNGNGSPVPNHGRKLRKSIKGRQAKGCDSRSHQHCRTEAVPIESGRMAAEGARSKPPSTLHAQNSVLKIGT